MASLARFGACDITRPDPELIEANGAAQMAMVGKALVSVRWFAEADRLFRPTLTRRKRSSTSSIWVSQAIAAASGGLGKKQKRPPKRAFALKWCGREDLNLHGVAPIRT